MEVCGEVQASTKKSRYNMEEKKMEKNMQNAVNAIVPVTFAEALKASSKGTEVDKLFDMAYQWGNAQAIPKDALRNIWPTSSLANVDRMEKYLDSVYFIRYCALHFWQEVGNNPKVAEEWRTKGMDEWAKLLNIIECNFKRNNADWLYLVARATIDGKQSKEETIKVIKPKGKEPFRKNVEMLIGMAINGYVFTNAETFVTIAEGRAEKAKQAEAKKAEKQAKAEAKKAEEAPKAKDKPTPKAEEKPAKKPAQKADTAKKPVQKTEATKPLDKKEFTLPEKATA